MEDDNDLDGPRQVSHGYAMRDVEAIRAQEAAALEVKRKQQEFFPMTNTAIELAANDLWESLPERPKPRTPQFLKLPLRVVGILPPIDNTVPTNLNNGQRCEWYREGKDLYKSLEVREPGQRIVFEEEDVPEGFFAPCCARPQSDF